MNSESRVFGETMRIRRVKKLETDQAIGSNQIVPALRNESSYCVNGVCEVSWKPERQASSLPGALKFGAVRTT